MKITFARLSWVGEEALNKLKSLGFEVEETDKEYTLELKQKEEDWLIYVYRQACMKVARKLATSSPNNDVTQHKDFCKMMEEVRKINP